MRPAAIGVVEHHQVAREEFLEFGHGGSHRRRHAAQMHRDVRSLRDHARFGVEDGAAEIQPLADIGAEAGAPQRHAHFFRDRRKQVLEDFQADGVNRHFM